MPLTHRSCYARSQRARWPLKPPSHPHKLPSQPQQPVQPCKPPPVRPRAILSRRGGFGLDPRAGTSWSRAITLNVPPDADPAAIKTQLLAAAVEALEDYREEIERQSREIQRTTASRHGSDAVPTVRLKFSADGVVAQVRYPVHLQHATEIDERVWHALLKVVPTSSTAASDA